MNASDEPRLTSSALRAGLWFLTFVELAVGLVATLAVILHVTHLENFTTAAAVGQTTALTLALLPVALLVLTGRRRSN